MGTVLLGWELGGGLAHVSRLLDLADPLVESGHTVVLAVKDTPEVRSYLRGTRHPVVAAPRWPQDTPRRFRAASYADILAVRGYDDRERLQERVAAWRSRLRAARPDVVVCDHAPTLSLAAWGDLPRVIVGSGFTVPPCDGDGFPRMGPSPRGSRTPQEKLLDHVNWVLRRQGRGAIFRLPELLGGAARFIWTIPEMDPYRCVRRERLNGPFRVFGAAPDEAPEVDYFAYLSAGDARLPRIVQTLAEAGLRGAIFPRTATPALCSALANRRTRIYAEPPPLSDVIRKARVVLHYGGIETSLAAAAIGRPQVLLPRHLEQELNAVALYGQDVANFLLGRADPRQVAGVVRQVLRVPRYAEAAKYLARILAERNWTGGPEPFLAHVGQLLV